MKRVFRDQKGQSLIEVVIAMAVFSVIAGAIMSVTLGSLNGLIQGGEETEARAFAEEGMEAVRSVRDHAWNVLTISPAQVGVSGSVWTLSRAASELIGNKFTRIITLTNVCRDGTDTIAVCPATYTDPHTKLVTVNVRWAPRSGATNSVEQTGFISNWDSRDWTQTDWHGGSGQAIFSDVTRYGSDDGGIDTRTNGQVTLAEAAEGVWAASAGAGMLDTTAADFNAGTYSSTTASGSGTSASVVLTQAVDWSLHTDTGNQRWNDSTCITASDCWMVGDAGALAHYNGTSWVVSAMPSSANVHAVFAISSSNVWAVGSVGSIWHYNGTTWSLDVDTGNEEWNDVACATASDCWVVGNTGALAHYDGARWVVSAIPSSANVRAIHVISATDIWAVGASGSIWHDDGSAWSLYTSTGSEQWNDVACTSSNECWAVGNAGAVATYDGVRWTRSTVPSSANINGMFALSRSDIWAVGASGHVWNYNGTSWSLHTDTGNGEDWQSVWMTSAGMGWMGDASGQLFHYTNRYKTSGTFQSRIFDSGANATTWDIASWTELIPSGGDITVAVRAGNTATPDGSWSAWSGEVTDPLGSAISAVGRYAQYRLTLTRPTDEATTPELADITMFYNTPTNAHLNAVDMVSANSGWIVGNGGVIMRYDGTRWTTVPSPVVSDLLDIAMVSATDGWAVGASGKMVRYDGSRWNEYTDTGNQTWNAVDMLTATDGWAVGNAGELAHWDGSAWNNTITSPTSIALHDVHMASSTSAWAVGADGSREILFYDGTSWSMHTNMPGSEAVRSVFFSSATDGWAVGDSGQVMRYDGANWNDTQDTGADAWRDGACAGTDDCWIVGDNGSIGRWNGAATWSTAIPSPTRRPLNGIDMVSRDNGWAVGANGTILHFTRDAIYLRSGSFVSSAFPMSRSAPIQVVEWDETNPPGTNIQLQIRAAPDVRGSPGVWTSWYGANGVDTYFTTARGALVPEELNGNQWVQYRTELRGDGTHTPVLQAIRVNYK